MAKVFTVTTLVVMMGRDPRIKCREWLLEQRELLDSCIAGGFGGQLARFHIKRAWHGEDNFLTLEPRFLISSDCGVPSVAQMHQVAGGRFHWRDHRLGWLCLRGQDMGAAMHARMGEPRFGRGDLATRYKGSLFAGKHTGDHGRPLIPCGTHAAG